MLLSPIYRSLFVHVANTAGSSVGTAHELRRRRPAIDRERDHCACVFVETAEPVVARFRPDIAYFRCRLDDAFRG